MQSIGAGVRGPVSLSIPTEMDWQRHTTAASGYLDLGMGQEAWDELDSMPPQDRARCEVVVMRLVILQAMARWDKAAEIARGSTRREPVSASWRRSLNLAAG